MEYLPHIFNLSWISHSFPSIWKTSSISDIHKMGKPLDFPASFRPISLTFCVSKLFKRIILSRLLFFLESNSILSPRQASFRPGCLLLIKFCTFLSPFRMGLTNPGRALGRFSLLSISRKLLTLSGIPLFFHKLISAGLHSCFPCWTQSFLSDRRTCVVYQNHKSCSFRVRRGVPQGSVLVLYFTLSSLMIFWPLCLLPSAALFTITIWSFGFPPPRSPLRWRPYKEP